VTHDAGVNGEVPAAAGRQAGYSERSPVRVALPQLAQLPYQLSADCPSPPPPSRTADEHVTTCAGVNGEVPAAAGGQAGYSERSPVRVALPHLAQLPYQ
jgi:hypothetical protein